MQHILMKIKLKPGSRDRFMEYVREFESRRAECDASLKAEGADVESFFLDGDVFYVFKRMKDMEEAKKHQKTSGKPIYDVVARFTEDCLGEREDLKSILAFDVDIKG